MFIFARIPPLQTFLTEKILKILKCPTCGKSLEFLQGASEDKKCPDCEESVLADSAAFSEDDQVDVSRASLQEDISPFRIGTRGRYEGQHFELIARCQMHWVDGRWDEWLMRFDDGKTSWLAHAQGTYTVMREIILREKVTPYSLKMGEKVPFLEGLTVTDKKVATRISCEGRLPPGIEEGQKVTSFDLRKEGENQFASIDFFQGIPTAFKGCLVDFDRLNFTNLRAFNGWPKPK